MATEEMKGNERDIASKLHRQFGHPTPKTLIKIIDNAGTDNKDLEKEIDTISQMGRTCLKHRRPFSRPVVYVPLAYELNEMLGIDLKTWGNNYF